MYETANSKTLALSLIMAIRNEAPHLRTTLASLAIQTLDAADWEILVAVAPSHDGSYELLESAKFSLKGLPKLTLIENPMGTAAAGLNLALAQARGSYVARLDGHCELAPDYLEKALSRLREGLYACVGGPQTPEGRGPWGSAYARAQMSLAGNGGASYRRAKKSGASETVYLGAWPRAILEAAGGFDESLVRNQDDELAMRLRDGGGLIYLDLEMRSIYRPRETLSGILSQYFHYGLWKPRVLRRHPFAVSPRHLLPSLWFLGILATLALTITTLSWGPLLFFAVWILLAWMFVQPSPGPSDPMQVLRAMLLITLMPFVYGAGFILGTPAAFVSRPRLGEFGSSQA